jgi:hypothetical protein
MKNGYGLDDTTGTDSGETQTGQRSGIRFLFFDLMERFREAR